MTPIQQIRNSVKALQAQGHSLREISRLLHLSRNTVRRILREPPRAARGCRRWSAAMQQRLQDVYARAQGNAVRMAQILADEHDQALPYSTLTRWVREAELRAAAQALGRVPLRARPGDAARHLAAPLVIAGKTAHARSARR